MSIPLLSAFLWPLIASIITYYLGRKNELWRNSFVVLAYGLSFFLVIASRGESLAIGQIMGVGLHLSVDGFRFLFAILTTFVWWMTTLYSLKYIEGYEDRDRYFLFFNLTYWATLSLFMTDNLINLFTFFEIMSFTSYALIIHDEDPYAHEAGVSYIRMAILGGLVMFLGILMLYEATGTFVITEMMAFETEALVVPALIVMFGFAVKASVYPLHTWLPKAHPAAPAPASAILSGILLKAGLYGILLMTFRVLAGYAPLGIVLIILGLINMVFGGFLALLQRNVKRILAYSSMSQVGYILLGAGMAVVLGDHGAEALYASLFHLVNHAFFKVLLFLAAGIIYMALHELSLNKIRGFGHHKPFLKTTFILGMLALMGFPGTGGYVSKTMLHEVLLELAHDSHSAFFTVVEWLFVLASGLTVAYLMKIFFQVFVARSDDFAGQHRVLIGKRIYIPMFILGGVLVFTGFYPGWIDGLLVSATTSMGFATPHPHGVYNAHGFEGLAIVLGAGVLIYVVVVRGMLMRRMGDEVHFHNPSLDWPSLEADVYVPVFLWLFHGSSRLFHRLDNIAIDNARRISRLWRAFLGVEWRGIDLQPTLRRMVSVAEKRPKKPDLEAMRQKMPSVPSFEMPRVRPKPPEVHTLREVVDAVFSRVNTVTYGLFVAATLLVLMLVYVLA